MYLRPFISKMFYAVLLSPLQPKQSTLAHLRSALSQTKSTYERTFSAVNVVDRILPGIANAVSGWMYKNNRFPWAPVDIELIAFGSGAAVFKLNWRDGVKVLRLYRRSVGTSADGLLEIAEYYKGNYETVRSWYGALVLPMEFLVLPGLPLVGPVAASLQPYIPGERQDLFDDFSEDELLKLLKADDTLREQFLCFARQTIRQWEERKMCYDFLGRENILLARQGGKYRLHIVDVGIFRSDHSVNTLSGKAAQIEQRMQTLTSLHERANKIQSVLEQA